MLLYVVVESILTINSNCFFEFQLVCPTMNVDVQSVQSLAISLEFVLEGNIVACMVVIKICICILSAFNF